MHNIIPPFPNHLIASRLEEAAERVARQGGEPYRARAYQRAADLVRRFETPIGEILARDGHDALRALRGIGEGLSDSIEEAARRGSFGSLEELRAADDHELLYCGIAGIGPSLAAEIHETLGISTLQELAIATVDGRLETVAGMTPARARMVLKTIPMIDTGDDKNVIRREDFFGARKPQH